MLTAYIDESLRRRPHDDSVYAMAAAIIDSADHEAVRADLESPRLGKSPRLHWREESRARQLVISRAITLMPLKSLVTIHMFDRGVSYEGARRLCLERLLYELDQEGVGLATIESRSAKMDHLDLLLVMGIRKAKFLSDEIRVVWQYPDREPLLWAADAVAGAVTWWLDGQPDGFNVLVEHTRLVCTN
ncbi:hypothetical protein Ppa06_21950 [Planomonospora parontospora subsp. parontospora]|uniref:DUF3800 domain-containing protein n=2 Tax=Planomonospora parontospora TaxID=58119 RepID=A0AA37BGN1_9ACTN|nr:DUF3800 domain-containing protein [Planomonospora parontospora]GGK65746.1 hypothetical protein GCM10010126_26360 [Planomonospora parontospora]GII08397.1 hypothetical protein Ppa06_21950 [Planomonospora parontospora subsp. parontospora]